MNILAHLRSSRNSILGWLNLLDSEQKLSLTNLALVALVIKMLFAPTLDWPSVTAMIVTFANYMHKRQSTDAAESTAQSDEMKSIKAQYEAAVIAQAQAIKDVKDQLGRVSAALDFSKMVKR